MFFFSNLLCIVHCGTGTISFEEMERFFFCALLLIFRGNRGYFENIFFPGLVFLFVVFLCIFFKSGNFFKAFVISEDSTYRVAYPHYCQKRINFHAYILSNEFCFLLLRFWCQIPLATIIHSHKKREEAKKKKQQQQKEQSCYIFTFYLELKVLRADQREVGCSHAVDRRITRTEKEPVKRCLGFV